jgi:hypothetical protein
MHNCNILKIIQVLVRNVTTFMCCNCDVPLFTFNLLTIRRIANRCQLQGTNLNVKT